MRRLRMCFYDWQFIRRPQRCATKFPTQRVIWLRFKVMITIWRCLILLLDYCWVGNSFQILFASNFSSFQLPLCLMSMPTMSHTEYFVERIFNNSVEIIPLCMGVARNLKWWDSVLLPSPSFPLRLSLSRHSLKGSLGSAVSSHAAGPRRSRPPNAFMQYLLQMCALCTHGCYYFPFQVLYRSRPDFSFA